LIRRRWRGDILSRISRHPAAKVFRFRANPEVGVGMLPLAAQNENPQSGNSAQAAERDVLSNPVSS